MALKREMKSSALFQNAVSGKCGLEIGGPSGLFQDGSTLPIYRVIRSLDNCVFCETTVWEGTREDGEAFAFYPGKIGRNLVMDGTDLTRIPDHSYDFVLSCHSLEHIANPVKALRHWVRVTVPGGALIVVLPDYRRTFDRRRTPTPVSHMLDDFTRSIGEDDLTHLPEVLARHDLWKDPAAGDREAFEARAKNNFQNRCLHHHVFDEGNSRELLEEVGLTVHVVERAPPHHIALLTTR